MIHHISISAQDPLRVASVLAEIWNGKVYKFLYPDSYTVMPFNNYGTSVFVNLATPGQLQTYDSLSSVCTELPN